VIEDKVRAVIIKHLREQNEEFVPQKGAGPDIVKKGVALEVKGSGFDLNEALKQLTRYAFTYAGLEVAFPVDAINLNFLHGLYFLERALESKGSLINRTVINMYLVAKLDEEEYVVAEFGSVKILCERIVEKLSERVKVLFEEPDKAIGKVSPVICKIEQEANEALKEYIKSGSALAYKVSL